MRSILPLSTRYPLFVLQAALVFIKHRVISKAKASKGQPSPEYIVQQELDKHSKRLYESLGSTLEPVKLTECISGGVLDLPQFRVVSLLSCGRICVSVCLPTYPHVSLLSPVPILPPAALWSSAQPEQHAFSGPRSPSLRPWPLPAGI